MLARGVCSVSQLLTRQRPAILAVDFDETLTKHCTLASVVAVAQQKHHDCRSDFQWCTDEYMKDVSAYEVKWQATVRDQSSQTAWSQDLLNEYLEGVLPIERASLERLSTHKILAGVSRKEFHIGGSSVELCPGAAACINRVLNDPRWRVRVVSINWSEDFIRGALEAAGVNVASSALGIHCNNPVFAADTGLSTGKIGPSVVGAKDKVDLLIRAKNCAQQEHGGVPLLVYAGDSLTDLPALILADIGLLFGNNRGVVEWCQRLGIDFGKPRGVEKSRILYKLTSWDTAEHLLQDHIGSGSSPHA